MTARRAERTLRPPCRVHASRIPPRVQCCSQGHFTLRRQTGINIRGGGHRTGSGRLARFMERIGRCQGAAQGVLIDPGLVLGQREMALGCSSVPLSPRPCAYAGMDTIVATDGVSGRESAMLDRLATRDARRVYVPIVRFLVSAPGDSGREGIVPSLARVERPRARRHHKSDVHPRPAGRSHHGGARHPPRLSRNRTTSPGALSSSVSVAS